MARSQNSFIKKQKEQKKQQKKKEKEARKKERQENNSKGEGLDSMMAYLDADGNIVTEKPEEVVAPKKVPREKYQGNRDSSRRNNFPSDKKD